eukprot:GHVQ01019962.1.p1 GENE.GHVQ01019962.1~~GHVQ01019962.1.p1  ORF type:complete len:221 (+),score=32.66 GHVQ01019962.1:146-808(+)
MMNNINRIPLLMAYSTFLTLLSYINPYILPPPAYPSDIHKHTQSHPHTLSQLTAAFILADAYGDDGFTLNQIPVDDHPPSSTEDLYAVPSSTQDLLSTADTTSCGWRAGWSRFRACSSSLCKSLQQACCANRVEPLHRDEQIVTVSLSDVKINEQLTWSEHIATNLAGSNACLSSTDLSGEQSSMLTAENHCRDESDMGDITHHSSYEGPYGQLTNDGGF